MQFFIPLLLCLIPGTLGALLAIKKNRNFFLWFIICFFIGIIGIIFLSFLPKINTEILPCATSLKTELQNSNSIENLPLKEEKNKNWYYLNEDKKHQGPFKEDKLLSILSEKENPENVWVWNKEFKDWEKLKNIPQLLKELRTK